MSFVTALYTIFIRPLELLFEVIYVISNRVIQNPGMSIVALSLAMNFLVLPLYRRADELQAQEQEIEKKLNKRVTHIKKTFKGDERFLMLQEFYRQNNYKPIYALRGSFSLLLEIPFFIAAYRFLSGLEMIKGISFGPIKNLGEPDNLLNIGSLPINVLPILMTLINIVSSAIYTKGMPLKSKIQLNVMALIFLVFLYKSPAGLVFYWTLNNIFSLVKNVFYKLKNPARVLEIIASVTGFICILFFGMFYTRHLLKRRIFFIGCGILLQIPLIIGLLRKKQDLGRSGCESGTKINSNRKLFWLSALVNTALIGIVIPMSVISASPSEFIDIAYFGNPIGYLWFSGLLAIGTFIVWMGIFYGLASEKGKSLMSSCNWILACIMVFDFMVFGSGYGNISSSFQFDKNPAVPLKKQYINFAAIILIAFAAYLISKKLSKLAEFICLVGLTALVVMGVSSVKKTNHELNTKYTYVKKQVESMKNIKDEGLVHLSRNGKNVVVIMLDRAIGSYIPYIMGEKPELIDQFDGFTYYGNTMSFGKTTITGGPALFGGYEYIPDMINSKKDELFREKHNQSSRLMPVLFLNNGFKVRVCEPPLAGCNYIPDLSIFDDYPDIKVYTLNKKYNSVESKSNDIAEKMRERNFFCYSIYKAAPLVLQESLYNDGLYNDANANGGVKTLTVQIKESVSKAHGLDKLFSNIFGVISNLDTMTKIENSDEKNYVFFSSDITHQPNILQKPDYVPSVVVDNTEYDKDIKTRYVYDGVHMKMDDAESVAHYDVNMCAMIQLGKWFDYLRKNGVYDNTRIILASDHGYSGRQFDNLIVQKKLDIMSYSCLLMVKDFGAKGFVYSDEYMTNADVPSLAFKGLIDNPVNPFTGNPVSSEAKENHNFSTISNDVKMEKFRDGYTYPDNTEYYSFKGDNIKNTDGWTYIGKK